MEYRIDLKGDTSAAERGAAALREEGKAARELVAELSGVARAYEEAASARVKAEGAAARPSSAPAFSASRDEDFKRSRWEQDSAGARQAEQAAAGKRQEDERGEKASLGAGRAAEKAGKLAVESGGRAALTLKDLAAGALAYGAALAGIHGVADLTRMAVGWRGMAQLQMLSWKATMDLRRDLRGVDPSPITRSASRLESMLSMSTVTGRTLSGVLERGFNSAFSAIERLEPIAEAVFQGMLIGVLQVEIAWQRARATLAPVTVALEEALGDVDGIGLAADATTGAFRAMAAVIDTIASGIRAASDAYDALNTRISRRSMSEAEQIRLGNQDRRDAERAARDAEGTAKGRRDVSSYNEKGEKVGEQHLYGGKEYGTKAEADAAEEAGRNTARGFVRGMDSESAAVRAAGGRMGMAGVEGAKEATETRSPSQVTRRFGRNLGEGEIKGLDEMGPEIDRAAQRNLVPDVAPGTAGGSPGPAAAPMSIGQIGPFIFPGLTDKSDVRPAVEAAVIDAVRGALVRLGLPIPGATG